MNILKKIKKYWWEIITLITLFAAVFIEGPSWTIVLPSLIAIGVVQVAKMIVDLIYEHYEFLRFQYLFASQERCHILLKIKGLEEEIRKLKDK